jgi:hypothetical protein
MATCQKTWSRSRFSASVDFLPDSPDLHVQAPYSVWLNGKADTLGGFGCGGTHERQSLYRFMISLMVRALVSGAIASVTASVALASCAKRERRSPPQPLNTTSHWLHGAWMSISDAPLTMSGGVDSTSHARAPDMPFTL